MNMKGLEISTTNSDLIVKHEEVRYRLFVMFKDIKYGTKYIIFTDMEGDKLYFGSPLVNQEKLVIMKFKDIRDQDNVKEFTWKYLNNEGTSNYEIIEIPNITKLEVIDYNTLDVKKEFIDKLNDIFFKEEEVEIKKEEIVENKKNNKFSLVFIIIFIIFLILGGYYLYNNKELIYGKNIYVSCTKKYNVDDIKVNASEVVELTFSNSKVLKSHTKEIDYVFIDSDIYYNFKEKNLEYKYFKEEGSKKYIDEEKKFLLFINYDINDNTIPNGYDEIFTYYTNLNYNCGLVSE